MKNNVFSGNILFYLLSIAVGVSVSCLYLNQPLLQTLGTELNTANGNIGLVASFTQIGYALGLFFIVALRLTDISSTTTELWMVSGLTFRDCDFATCLCTGKKSSERINDDTSLV